MNKNLTARRTFVILLECGGKSRVGYGLVCGTSDVHLLGADAERNCEWTRSRLPYTPQKTSFDYWCLAGPWRPRLDTILIPQLQPILIRKTGEYAEYCGNAAWQASYHCASFHLPIVVYRTLRTVLGVRMHLCTTVILLLILPLVLSLFCISPSHTILTG